MMQEPRQAMEKYFTAIYDEGQQRLSFTRLKEKDFPTWQQRLRTKLMDLLAVTPTREYLVGGEIIGEEQMEGYRRQYVCFTSRDGVTIPAYKLVPDNLSTPAPAVICQHGHGPGKVIPAAIGKDIYGNEAPVEGERDFAVQAVQQGYIALAPDARGFGEMMLPEEMTGEYGESSCRQMSMRAIMVGRSLLGMRVLDTMSAVDYLLADEQVNGKKIAITGHSGGGTVCLFATALEPRIACAAPSCYFCTFKHSIMAMFHCECNFVPGLLNLCEMYDVAGLIAPRPLLIIAGQKDPIFPIEGVYEAFEKLKAIYAAAGASDKLELYVGPEDHRYYSQRMWPLLAESFSQQQ